MFIRPATAKDKAAIYAVNALAFETPAEANLVDALREKAHPTISLVAERQEKIVGHIMFSPISLPSHPAAKIMGLAPLAVIPSYQRQGIGSDLVKAGLSQCKQQGFIAVVVLGHPEYYTRFGFAPATCFNIRSEYEVSEEALMVLELQPGALGGKTGTISYHSAFSQL